MLGTFRIRTTHDTSVGMMDSARLLHCTSCNSIRRRYGAIRSLSLSYECDLLLCICLGSTSKLRRVPRLRRVSCTAFPMIGRSVLDVPDALSDTVAAFGIVAAWATLSDGERDEGSMIKQLLRRSLDSELNGALTTLGIQIGTPPDPRLICRLDESRHESIDAFLDDYRVFVGGLWAAAIQVGTDQSGTRQPSSDRLGKGISDIMVLSDAIEDRNSDRARLRPNPACTEAGLRECLERLRMAVVDVRWMLVGLEQPWNDIALTAFDRVPSDLPIARSSVP